MNIAPDLMTHRARGCPFIANVDGEDFVIDGFAKYKGYGDECKTIYFAGVALFQDEENKENGNLVFQFCFEYSYDTDEYKCYSNHFSDKIIENDFENNVLLNGVVTKGWNLSDCEKYLSELKEIDLTKNLSLIHI